MISEFTGRLHSVDCATAWAAGPQSLPGHVAVLSAAAAAAAFVVISQLISRRRRTARACYWAGSAATAALIAAGAAMAGRPPRQVLLATALTAALAAGFAYFGGWQIKIGGRIRAAFVANTRPDPPEEGAPPPPAVVPANSYGGTLTAEGLWWIAVVLSAVVAADIVIFGWTWQAVGCAAVLTVLGFLAGSDDSGRGHAVARGQRGKALAAAVASVPMLLAPPVAYAIGYRLGKRSPSGPGSHSADT